MKKKQAKKEVFITNSFGDKYLYSICKNLFSGKQATVFYDRKFKQILNQKNQFTVIIGTDSGLILRYFKEKKLPGGAYVLCLELPQVYQRLKKDGLIAALNPQLDCKPFSAGSTGQTTFDLGAHLHVDNIVTLVADSAAAAYVEEYREMAQAAQDQLMIEQRKLAAAVVQEPYLLTQARNITENLIAADYLKDSFVGKTAFVLGGGPSLDDSLPWLLEHRDAVVVFAATRISARLVEVGLTPDVLIAIDPRPVNFQVSKEMFLFQPHPVLIHADHADLTITAQWPGSCLYCGGVLPWDSPLNRNDFPRYGPTVSNQAVSIALGMGFKDIYLAGVDLCFSPAGYSHAKGSHEHLAGPDFKNQHLWVKTNAGAMAATNYNMEQAIAPLSQQAVQARAMGSRIINTALHGAAIPGVPCCALDAIELSAAAPGVAGQVLAERIPMLNEEQRAAIYAGRTAELHRARASVTAIKALAEEALGRCESYAAQHGQQFAAIFQDVTVKLQQHEALTSFVHALGAKDFVKVQHLFSAQQPPKRFEEDVLFYLQALQRSSVRALNIVNSMLKRLDLRLAEDRLALDDGRVFAQWEADKTPYRATLIKARHPHWQEQLSEEAINKLNALESTFTKQMGGRCEWLLKAKQNSASPEIAHSSALKFRQSGNRHGLEQLVAGLRQLNTPYALQVAAFAQGLLEEMHNKNDQALVRYQELLTEDVPQELMIDSLRRIASISLSRSDFENALIAYDCLAAIKSEYLRQYADLVKALGDVRRAVDLYADYLEQMPEDIGVMLTLAKIYAEQGVRDGAQLLCRSVLELSPDHPEALVLLTKVSR